MKYTDAEDPRIDNQVRVVGAKHKGEDITIYLSDGNEIFLKGEARVYAEILAELGCYCGEKILAEIEQEDKRHEKGKTKAADGR